MAHHDPQLLKGVLPLVLLRLLWQREDYGYAVLVRLHDAGFAGLAEGTVYPALTRLEKRGLIVSRLVKSTSGPARKYYRLSPAGTAELQRATAAWNELVTTVNGALTAEEQTDQPMPEEATS